MPFTHREKEVPYRLECIFVMIPFSLSVPKIESPTLKSRQDGAIEDLGPVKFGIMLSRPFTSPGLVFVHSNFVRDLAWHHRLKWERFNFIIFH